MALLPRETQSQPLEYNCVIKMLLKNIKLVLIYPYQTLTHQLQPGVGHQHLVLLILQRQKKRGKKREKFFFWIREETSNNSYLIKGKRPMSSASLCYCFAFPKKNKGYGKQPKSWFCVTKCSPLLGLLSGTIFQPFMTTKILQAPVGSNSGDELQNVMLTLMKSNSARQINFSK